MNSITAHALKPLLTAEDEIALLDVREYGQYGEGHPFFSVPFPYSRLEARAPLLLPRKGVHLVLLDDGDGVAARAASQFESRGYQNVSILEGGAPAWAAAGYTLYKGVNVQSKTYGELLEHVAETPSVTASELSALLERDPSVV
ncbi:MAG: rhodanese-like domain-containing protein, partial [Woeseiales bacterium]